MRWPELPTWIVVCHLAVVNQMGCLHAHRRLDWHPPNWSIRGFDVTPAYGFEVRFLLQYWVRSCCTALKNGHWRQMCHYFRCLLSMGRIYRGNFASNSEVSLNLLSSRVLPLEATVNLNKWRWFEQAFCMATECAPQYTPLSDSISDWRIVKVGQLIT